MVLRLWSMIPKVDCRKEKIIGTKQINANIELKPNTTYHERRHHATVVHYMDADARKYITFSGMKPIYYDNELNQNTISNEPKLTVINGRVRRKIISTSAVKRVQKTEKKQNRSPSKLPHNLKMNKKIINPEVQQINDKCLCRRKGYTFVTFLGMKRKK